MLEECDGFALISQGDPGLFGVDVEPRSVGVVRGGDCGHYSADQTELILRVHVSLLHIDRSRGVLPS